MTNNPDIVEPEYLDLTRLSIYASLAVSTLRDHIRQAGLPHYKVRGKILVKRSEFDLWMNRFHQDPKRKLSGIVNDAMQGLKKPKNKHGLKQKEN